MLELYANIKKYRKEKGMSQETLAKLTGYTDRSSIAKIEKGEIDIPQSKIGLFATALGVTPSDLMGNTGLKEKPTAQMSDELASFIEAYESASPTLRNAALSVLKSGAPADETPPMRPDTAQ